MPPKKRLRETEAKPDPTSAPPLPSPEADDDEDEDEHIDKKPRAKNTKASTKASTSKRASAWTKTEVRQLWAALDIVPKQVQWDAVAAQVGGRSKIACRDKWIKDILPRLMQFIDSRGE